jgi:hypothetical protein
MKKPPNKIKKTKKNKKNKTNPSVIPKVYLLCEFQISFTLLLLLLSQTTQKKDWKQKKKETTKTTTTTTTRCVRACTGALFACEDGDFGRCLPD